MKTMKKLVAALIVMTMLVTLASTAFAADCITCGKIVKFTCNAHSYTDHKDSAKTGNVVKASMSVGKVKRVKGKFALVIVNWADGTSRWFRKCDLKVYNADIAHYYVVWAKGGHDMSSTIDSCERYKLPNNCKKLKVTFCETNLRKTHSLEGRRVATVKKGTKLTYKGYIGFDNRVVMFYKVCYKGKCCWVSNKAVVPVKC